MGRGDLLHVARPVLPWLPRCVPGLIECSQQRRHARWHHAMRIAGRRTRRASPHCAAVASRERLLAVRYKSIERRQIHAQVKCSQPVPALALLPLLLLLQLPVCLPGCRSGYLLPLPQQLCPYCLLQPCGGLGLALADGF